MAPTPAAPAPEPAPHATPGTNARNSSRARNAALVRNSARARHAALARKASALPAAAGPPAGDRGYTAPESEFMWAMHEYRKSSGRMFPTWSEVLEVIRGLGYSKGDERG